jgi:CPA2 family monovalent cation:H+ antiporter-2
VVPGGLFGDIVLIFVAAFAGALVARFLRLPVLLGYLAVGMLIGPHALAGIENVETVRTLAEFGVILLLFAVGIEVSFRDLRRSGRVVIIGGTVQIVATAAVAYVVGLLLGWPAQASIVLGMVISLSSTMVVLRTLMQRHELQSVHGRVITGILVVQDLAFVPMIAILPALNGSDASFALDLGLGLLKAGVALSAMILLGGRLLPWLLERVALLGSREVFILSVVAITVSTAAMTQALGLSAALGAFLAGLVLSESDFGRRALSEVVPLRDTFAALFFVSLGMLTDLSFLANNLSDVVVVVSVVIFAKFLIVSGIMRAFGYLLPTSVLAGVGLVQVGEFSFILAGSAVALGIVEDEFLSLTVVSAVLTMAITPWIMGGGTRVVGMLSARFSAFRLYHPDDDPEGGPGPEQGHVVLAGLGRVGSLVAEVLTQHQVPFVSVELDARSVAKHRGLGYTVVYGDIADEHVLEAVRIQSARLMIISSGDANSAQLAVHHALRMNPALDVVARVHWREEGERLLQMGAREVVWPELEAGLEILRHSLRRYLQSHDEVDVLVDYLRTKVVRVSGEEVIPDS